MFSIFRTGLLAIAALAVGEFTGPLSGNALCTQIINSLLTRSVLLALRAEECEHEPFGAIKSQEEYDSLIQEGNCTSIRGFMGIAPTYTGPFILKNITTLWLLGVPGLTKDERPNISSIEMPDLLSVGTLWIEGLPGLSVSAPKLKNLTDLHISSDNVELSFPSLESAHNVLLEGILLK